MSKGSVKDEFLRKLSALLQRTGVGAEELKDLVEQLIDTLESELEQRVPRSNIWHTGHDYDSGFASAMLRKNGIPFMREVLHETPELKNPEQGAFLADFGCWAGRHIGLLKELSGEKGQVFGIDEEFAKERLEAASNTYRERVQFIDQGIAQTKLSPYSIDGAICWRVLHNMTRRGELSQALTTITKLLKPGAPFVVAVRKAFDWISQECDQPQLLRTFQQDGEREDLYFTERSIVRLFGIYDFGVEEIISFSEDELVDSVTVINDYFMVKMKKKSKVR